MADFSGIMTERKWGKYHVVARDKDWQVKFLIFKPRQKTSFQRHKYRSEQWIVIRGKGKVWTQSTSISRLDFIIKEGSTIFIPEGQWHQLVNTSWKEPLIVIEIWEGASSEDDVERKK